MPTYEYQCDSCRRTFDQFQSIKALPIEKCPTCGGPIRRLIGSGAGIIFKGSGFYQTDYRSASYKKRAEAEKKASSTPEKPASGSSSNTSKTGESPSSNKKSSGSS